MNFYADAVFTNGKVILIDERNSIDSREFVDLVKRGYTLARQDNL